MASSSSRNASVSPPRTLSEVVDSEDLKKHSEAVTAPRNALSEVVDSEDLKKHSEAVTAPRNALSEFVDSEDLKKHSEAVTAPRNALSEVVDSEDLKKHSEAVTAGDSSLKYSETVTGDSSVVGLWYKLPEDGKEGGHILSISAVQGGGYVAEFHNIKGDLLTELQLLPAPPALGPNLPAVVGELSAERGGPPTGPQVPPAPPTDLQVPPALCPNLSAIVGEVVAQNLIATAGGLTNLARTPSCNVRMLGANNLDALDFRVGHIGHTDMFINSPAALKSRICRLIANKVTLAARVDSVGEWTDGAYGNGLREEMLQKIESLGGE